MKTYSISEAAKLLNLPASTIRYYDSCGVLPTFRRDAAGRRIFTERDLKLLAAMRRGLDNGLSISEFHALYEAVMVCGSYSAGREILARKIGEINREISHLKDAQAKLEEIIVEYDRHIEAEDGLM